MTQFIRPAVVNEVHEARSRVSVSAAGVDAEFLEELGCSLMPAVGKEAVEAAPRDNM